MDGERLNKSSGENQWERTEFDTYNPELAAQRRETERQFTNATAEAPTQQMPQPEVTPVRPFAERSQEAAEAWQRMEGKNFDLSQLGELQKALNIAESVSPILQSQGDKFNYHRIDPTRDAISREAAYNRASTVHGLGDPLPRQFNNIYLRASQHANRERMPFFDALKSEIRVYPYKDKDDFIPIDAMNNYVDTFTIHQMTEEPNLEVGLAKGLISRREMLLETAVHPMEGNPAADGLMIDNIFLKPYLAEFVQANNQSQNPEKLEDFLQQKSIELESSARVAKRHGQAPDLLSQNKIDAINRSLREIKDLRDMYANDAQEIQMAKSTRN